MLWGQVRGTIRLRAGLLVILALALTTTVSSAASIKGIAYKCPDRAGMCVWHMAVVSPPEGWAEDKEWTQRYRAFTIFRKGKKGKNDPLIYLRAHSGDKALSIEEYVSVAQERWKKRMTTSTIEPQPDLVRAGKPALKLYLYKNPSTPEQAFELTAFLKDVDDANPGETYFFQAVLVSPTLEGLEQARPAFLEMLGRL
jgi:hypothetical protein